MCTGHTANRYRIQGIPEFLAIEFELTQRDSIDSPFSRIRRPGEYARRMFDEPVNLLDLITNSTMQALRSHANCCRKRGLLNGVALHTVPYFRDRDDLYHNP